MKFFYPGKILLLGFFLTTAQLYAQNVGINTSGASPNAAAILDLNTGNAGTMGFLPEQVALTANNVAAPVVLPPIGLIVYNTATAGIYPNNVILVIIIGMVRSGNLCLLVRAAVPLHGL